ncbi:glutamine amidotransferase-related protein [Ostreibacterium oceani]|uniref:Glutamine amidotransferase domain-containing protein n=1 Tax=Ostreibacterium oceani TaxID=2654998 RepID=A0A6N7ERY2_9GAMM|nr:gamma-glutamyl-gamma-aminobutyrate hydrolase family protein [Ostreibacterium oceani]MPV85252.1 hypothetical protein [Ostreibacterium oceani]
MPENPLSNQLPNQLANREKLPILTILHRACGDMGKIGQFLTDQGYDIDVRCIIEGDELPDANDYAGVVVFGGVMSANDCQTIDGIRQEIEWIPSVIAAGVPYLGICLGAQLLARALGAGVTKKPDESIEIGCHHVRPTRQNCSLLPAQGLRFYQWHLEGFSIPESCERLAESDNFPNQAFMLNPQTIGLQFHPEATREMIDCWVQRESHLLALPGAQSYKTQIELYQESSPAVEAWLSQFLPRWLAA